MGGQGRMGCPVMEGCRRVSPLAGLRGVPDANSIWWGGLTLGRSPLRLSEKL